MTDEGKCVWAAAKPSRQVWLPGEPEPQADTLDLCGHQHRTEAAAKRCMERLGPDWCWWVKARHLPVQEGDGLVMFNRYPYTTGGETVDLSTLIRRPQ